MIKLIGKSLSLYSIVTVQIGFSPLFLKSGFWYPILQFVRFFRFPAIFL